MCEPHGRSGAPAGDENSCCSHAWGVSSELEHLSSLPAGVEKHQAGSQRSLKYLPTSAFACWGCHDKAPQTGVGDTQQKRIFSHSGGYRSENETKVPAGLVPSETSLLGLQLSSQGRPSVGVCALISSYKESSYIVLGLTLTYVMISFYLNYLFKDPISKQSYCEVRGGR